MFYTWCRSQWSGIGSVKPLMRFILKRGFGKLSPLKGNHNPSFPKKLCQGLCSKYGSKACNNDNCFFQNASFWRFTAFVWGKSSAYHGKVEKLHLNSAVWADWCSCWLKLSRLWTCAPWGALNIQVLWNVLCACSPSVMLHCRQAEDLSICIWNWDFCKAFLTKMSLNWNVGNLYFCNKDVQSRRE